MKFKTEEELRAMSLQELREEAYKLIMLLSEEEAGELMAKYKKEAALVREHQDGTAWVESPNSVPIIHQ